MAKRVLSIRISDVAFERLREASEVLGVDKVAVVEMALAYFHRLFVSPFLVSPGGVQGNPLPAPGGDQGGALALHGDLDELLAAEEIASLRASRRYFEKLLRGLEIADELGDDWQDARSLLGLDDDMEGEVLKVSRPRRKKNQER